MRYLWDEDVLLARWRFDSIVVALPLGGAQWLKLLGDCSGKKSFLFLETWLLAIWFDGVAA
jgi:hypothetical protein